MTTETDERTTETVRALHAVNEHVPRVAHDLLAGTLPVVKQHAFAALLIELGELLHRHADEQTLGVIVVGRSGADSNPSGPRHAIRERSTAPPGFGDTPPPKPI